MEPSKTKTVRTRQFDNKAEFVVWLKNRTKEFSVRVVRFSDTLPVKQSTRVISYQLIKSATSVAANYRAACRARSGSEFYAKLCIVVEEADETVFWLEVVRDAALAPDTTEIESLYAEAKEITALMTTARKNAQPT